MILHIGKNYEASEGDGEGEWVMAGWEVAAERQVREGLLGKWHLTQIEC